MYRTQRQNRYIKLREAGFLQQEASVLSKVPFSVPYMPRLIRERKRLVDSQANKGYSSDRIAEGIKLSYEAEGYIRHDSLGRKLINPWPMLKKVENDYRDKHPEYRSPSQKTRKRYVNFIARYEKTVDIMGRKKKK